MEQIRAKTAFFLRIRKSTKELKAFFCVRRKPANFCLPKCTSTIGSVLILQYLLQTNAIKEFYEENEAEDQSGVNRLIWVTKKGIFFIFYFFDLGDQKGDASHSFHLHHCLLGGWLCQVSVRIILLAIVVFRFKIRAPLHRD